MDWDSHTATNHKRREQELTCTHTHIQLPPHFMVDFRNIQALARFCVAKGLSTISVKMVILLSKEPVVGSATRLEQLPVSINWCTI